MGDLSLSLLGTFAAEYERRPFTRFRTKAAQALLIYLACQPEVAHAREGLMALLWPELPPKSAQGNLRHALYHLRRVIPEVSDGSEGTVPFLLADRQTIQVNPASHFALDVKAFEAGSGAGASPSALETAVSLYRGDFLTDFYLPDSPAFENWAGTRRAALRRRLLDGLGRLTGHHIQGENFDQAERWARRQLESDNLREEGHRQLMMALAGNGRRAAAITHYQRLRQLLQDELGIDPSEETEALVTAIRSGTVIMAAGQQEVTEKPATPPHNLPTPATPFVGRQEELGALDGFLADPNTRLVTITGPGGIGKTRLALAVAARQRDQGRFSHGVFFASLAGLGASERIIPVIAETMQLRLEQGEKQLLAYLRARQVLLVLDNFEHLLDASDLVNRLLQAGRQVQIVVTSRERLRLQGEHIYPLQGLSQEPAAAMDDVSLLFTQAARRLRPNFEATEANRLTINRIGRLVEGMPLALELAAAWVNMFTLEDIAAEIQRNLSFLQSDLRDMPARHRSMQAVFDTSWQQLSVTLQQTLAAMAVFRGGCTREAAIAVTGASIRDLAALVNQSLLSFDPVANRYHLHELLRQYSLERLVDSAVRDRHCSYYLKWLIDQDAGLNGAEANVVLTQIDAEMDNIRAGINQAMRIGRVDDFDVVMWVLQQYAFDRSESESVALFDHIRTQLMANPDTPKRILFWATARQAMMLNGLGHSTISKQIWPQGKAYLAALSEENRDNRPEQAFAAYIDGFDLYAEKPAQARQLLQKSHDLALAVGDRLLAGYAMMALARSARNQGDLTAAEAAVRESIRLFQTLNAQGPISEAQLLLGNLASIAGRYEEAEQRLLAGIALARTINRPFSLANGGLIKLGMVYIYAGRFQEAMVPIREAQQLIEEFYYTWGMAQTTVCLSLLQLHQGRYAAAHEEGEKAADLGREHGLSLFICESLTLLAQARIATGDYSAAKERLQNSDAMCDSRPVGMPTYVASNSFYWGVVEAATGSSTAAWAHIISELEPALARKDWLNLANIMAAIAYLKALENDVSTAVSLYVLARQHPFVANSRWFADVIGARIAAATVSLAPEAITAAEARGQEMDPWETAASFLS